VEDTYSGQRYSGPTGPLALFGHIASLVHLLTRNPIGPIRIEELNCSIDLDAGRKAAEIESVRLATDILEPGQMLRATVTLKPFKGERQDIQVAMTLPDDLPEGTYEAALCDLSNSFRRRFRNEPQLLEMRDLDGILRTVRLQAGPKRTALYLHVPLPDRGLSVRGQPLPHLPGSARAVFAGARETHQPAIRADLIASVPTPWVVEGSETIKFTVVKDRGISEER
jgi:hypothetical protein